MRLCCCPSGTYCRPFLRCPLGMPIMACRSPAMPELFQQAAPSYNHPPTHHHMLSKHPLLTWYASSFLALATPLDTLDLNRACIIPLHHDNMPFMPSPPFRRTRPFSLFAHLQTHTQIQKHTLSPRANCGPLLFAMSLPNLTHLISMAHAS